MYMCLERVQINAETARLAVMLREKLRLLVVDCLSWKIRAPQRSHGQRLQDSALTAQR